MSRPKLINHRLPTSSDANEFGLVLDAAGDHVVFSSIDRHELWFPFPTVSKSDQELLQDLLDAIDAPAGITNLDFWLKNVKQARDAMR